MLLTASRAGVFTRQPIYSKRWCSDKRRQFSDFEYLTALFYSYIHSHHPMRGNISADQESLFAEKTISLGLHTKNLFEDEIHSIKGILKKSITESMGKVMGRVPGSSTGIMYSKEYHREVIKAGSYVEYVNTRLQPGMKFTSDYFETDDNDQFHFLMRKGVSPSMAINAFLEGPTRADCGSTVEAVYFKGVLDVLGEELFDVIFKDNLQISKWVCPAPETSLYPLLEFVHPKITAVTDEDTLEIGDHVIVRGVPWFNVKHPLSPMQNMHGIIMSFNAENEPLLGGLGLERALPLKQVKIGLVNAYNKSQSRDDMAFLENLYGDAYLSAEFINAEGKSCRGYINSAADIYKKYSVREVQAVGGCTIENENSCRLSPFVLAFLKSSPSTIDPQHALFHGKCIGLANQIHDLLSSQ